MSRENHTKPLTVQLTLVYPVLVVTDGSVSFAIRFNVMQNLLFTTLSWNRTICFTHLGWCDWSCFWKVTVLAGCNSICFSTRLETERSACHGKRLQQQLHEQLGRNNNCCYHSALNLAVYLKVWRPHLLSELRVTLATEELPWTSHLWDKYSDWFESSV